MHAPSATRPARPTSLLAAAVLGLLGSVAAGCFNPSLDPGGGYRCAVDSDCPPGTRCLPAAGVPGGKACQSAAGQDAGTDFPQRDKSLLDKGDKPVDGKKISSDKSQRPDKSFVPPDATVNPKTDSAGQHGNTLKLVTLPASTSLPVHVDVAQVAKGFQVAYEQVASAQDTTIYGLLLDSLGRPGTNQPVRLSTAAYRERYPAVSAVGTASMVVWMDERKVIANEEIYGALLRSDGAFSREFVVNDATNLQAMPDVSCTGTSCLAVWEDNRPGTYPGEDIYAVTVAPLGKPDSAVGWKLGTSSQALSRPAAALDPTSGRWLVVWQQGSGLTGQLHGVLTDTGGKTANTASTALTTYAAHRGERPAVAWAGGRFLVAWQRSAVGSETVRMATVEAKLPPRLSSQDGVDITPQGSGYQRDATVGCAGSQCVVAFTDTTHQGKSRGTDIWAARVSVGAAGPASKDAAGLAVDVSAGNQDHVAAAGGSSKVQLVWSGPSSGAIVVHGRQLAP